MEILKSFSPYDAFFRVFKSFLASPAEEKTRALKIGEVVRFDEKTPASDIIGWCRIGRIKLDGIPALGRYKANRAFAHRVGGRMVSVNCYDICEIPEADAWTLLLSGAVEPTDPTQWSPSKISPNKTKMIQAETEARLDDLSRLIAGGKPRIGSDWKVRK